MANPLGDISLRVHGKQDTFYQKTVEETAFSEVEEYKSLTDPAYIDGFNASFQEVALDSKEPDYDFELIDVPEGFQYVDISYRDGGYSDLQYDLLVLLIIEEEPELANK